MGSNFDSFRNTFTLTMVDAIETKLAQNQWLGGQQPSKEDAESFQGMAACPNACAWWVLCSRFTDDVRGTWTAAAAAAPAKEGGKKGKQEAPKPAAAAEEVDEMDLFGDEDPAAAAE